MIKRIKIELCICNECGYMWVPRTEGDLPIKCPNPRCQSYKWNESMTYEK